ncbi:MAG TPA: DUF1080 domain-containing protein [Clostridia bacterium]|nr:DUF1080 domain-containing protein [Clostridia bacterium]
MAKQLRSLIGSTCIITLLLGIYSAVAAESLNTLSAEEKAAGWKLLFDGKSHQGWRSFKRPTFPTRGWSIENGWFYSSGKGGGDIVSEGEYDQFELQWEWKLTTNGNSGVKYFVTENRNSALGHEYQMFDDERDASGTVKPGKHVTASFYDVLKPSVNPPTKPAGQINQSRILVQANHVEHWLNGIKVLEYKAGSEPVKAAVAASKFKSVPAFGSCVKGHILLQDHQSEVWFRNIKIRVLPQ